MSHTGSSKTREFSLPAAGPEGSGSRPAPLKGQVSPDDHTVISDRSPSGRSVAPGLPHSFALGNLSAGDRLCHFELLEYVGGGGMGAVFRARDTMLEREVAVKVLSRAQGADDETRRRFQVEAQSAARLDHQNIARVYYVGEDQGLNFIVFEFVRGVNIRDLVERDGPLSLSDAVSYTLQIAEALAHASGRQVVHRDIKPSNIIVTEDGRAKLVDMGLARLHAPAGNDDLTASGVTLGTFDYISPEQARDPRTADVRSDMYSLGCTLYYMLTGRPPFPDGTVLQKLLQHQADEVSDPRQFNPQVPEEIAEFVRRLLAKDPRRRFGDPAELIAELLMISSRLNLRPVTTGHFWIAPESQRSPWWERHLPWIVPVAALVLIASGIEWFPSSSLALPGPDALAPPPAVDAGGTRGKSFPRNAAQPTASSSTGLPAETSLARPDDSSLHPSTESLPAERRTDTRVAGDREPLDAGPGTGGAGTAKPSTGDEPRVVPRAAESVADIAVEPLLDDLESPFDFPVSPRSLVPRPVDRDIVRDTSAAGGVGRPRAEQAREPEPATAIVEPAERAGVAPAAAFSLIGGEGQRRAFTSLKGAAAMAKNNDVIELQFTGAREEEPLELTNLKLTLRAGEGYRPVLVFRPPQQGLSGLARSMFRITGGRLNLRNVGIVLDIPRHATAEGWTLFETQQAEHLRLDHCALTIRNDGNDGSAFHQNVSFFDVTAAPRADMNVKTAEGSSIHALDLELQDCIVRGEAVVVRSVDAQPLNFDWENGLLATTEALFSAEGTTVTPPSGERVQIALKHLTAIVQGGLVRMTATNDKPYLLKTEVSCANSFLITRGAPLVEQQGPQRVSLLEQQFDWSGDRNFCQGFSTFWQLTDLTMPTAPRLVSLAQWQAHFDRGDNALPPRKPIWKHAPAEDRPVNALRRDDFVLGERLRGTEDPFEASDAGEVGMDWRRLPDLGADSSPATRPGESPRESFGDTPRDSLRGFSGASDR